MSEAPIVVTNSAAGNRLLSNRPLLSSELLGWQGAVIDYRRLVASTMPEIYMPWHCISFVCKAMKTPTVIRCSGGKQWRDQARIGEAIIIPAAVGYGVAWDVELEALTVSLDPLTFASAIDPGQPPGQIELLPQYSLDDPLLYQLALGLKSILIRGEEGNRLYAETLTHTLIVHVLQHYTARPVSSKTDGHGLSKVRQQLVLDYIQAHLDQDLGLHQLANLLQLSPRYFAELFKQSMGVAPHQYVIQQRIERAQQFLKQGEMTITEVACRTGFANQSHLTRHFKRLVGITPGAFRRRHHS